MRTVAESWLQDWLPDVHLQTDGSRGGWVAHCENTFGSRFELHFDTFPTPEHLQLEAVKMVRKLNGKEILV